MYELSINEEIQRKARESAIKVLEKHGNLYTYEAVNEMEYIEQCINETLRLHSPALGTGRVAKQDYPIPNTDIVIEKGTFVVIPFSGIFVVVDSCVSKHHLLKFIFLIRHPFGPRHLPITKKIRSRSLFSTRSRETASICIFAIWRR